MENKEINTNVKPLVATKIDNKLYLYNGKVGEEYEFENLGDGKMWAGIAIDSISSSGSLPAILFSTDGGNTWKEIYNIADSTAWKYMINANLGNSYLGWHYTEGAFFKLGIVDKGELGY